MSRSPLAYPLNRGADTDVGGAADLQTDIMRFMAILSMCLLAIFALVQSIPLAPVEPAPEPQPQSAFDPVGASLLVNESTPEPAAMSAPEVSDALAQEPEPVVMLTRPKWTPKPVEVPSGPSADKAAPTTPEPEIAAEAAPAPPEPIVAETAPATPETEGFTLRFASDAALMRAVAAQHVGLYALAGGRARRMTVSNSRISFWDASTPSAFHEMETGTVPDVVIQALMRSGAEADAISWGVTLPGRMTTQLDSLMQAHRGGSLIITADGDIHWEAS